MRNKILLIEDEEMIVGLYEEAFKKAGFEIQSLRTGNQAIEAIREIREGKRERPDLILLDLILPDIEDAEVLKEFKKYPETKDIFVFVLTNYPNSRLKKELEKEGIDKFLVKVDYTPSQLIKIVKKTLK
jgi:DNA-binding response OmpR family regulator